MNEKLLAFLFEKRILVSSGGSEHPFEVLFTLANKFGIKITSGRNLASEELFPFVEKMLGRNIPLPFYKGFPETVKKLTPDQILFDQLFNYFMTYALDDFSEPRHSIFEEDFERLAFSEYTVPKEFRIVDCESAQALLGESVEDMLKSSRPLSQNYYEVLMTYVTEYKKKVKSCACKDTAIRLILDTGDIYYARFLSLADVVRVVDYVNYYRYQNENIKKLLCAAAAAGPCFEGANISCGMSASEGAVCAYSFSGGSTVIGGGTAKGVCATGLIDIIADGLRREFIDKTGYLEEDTLPICDGISLTKQDIREFQLAKSAIRAAIECLLHRAGIGFDDVEGLYVSGGFSAGINVKNATYLGLIPKALATKFHGINNSSLLGTVQYACAGKNVHLPLEYAEYVDLSTDALFSELFIKYISF